MQAACCHSAGEHRSMWCASVSSLAVSALLALAAHMAAWVAALFLYSLRNLWMAAGGTRQSSATWLTQRDDGSTLPSRMSQASDKRALSDNLFFARYWPVTRRGGFAALVVCGEPLLYTLILSEPPCSAYRPTPLD